jgi:hypothetical protein
MKRENKDQIKHWIKPTNARAFMEACNASPSRSRPDHFTNLSIKQTEDIFLDTKVKCELVDSAHTIAEFLLTYVDDPEQWEDELWIERLKHEVDLDDLALALTTLIYAVKQLNNLNAN